PPAFAWTTAVPLPLAGAVYRPALLIDPRPLSFDQVKLGWIARGWLNWSSAWAVNCCRARFARVTIAGVTTMLVRTWLTVTFTLLLAVRPPVSAMVTWNV